MAIFFIISLITYRYFSVEDRGLLSVFWATFFLIELFIIDLGATVQARIPNFLAQGDNAAVNDTIFSVYLVRGLSGLFIGIVIYILSEHLALIMSPISVDPLKLKFMIEISSLLFIFNGAFGPISDSVLIGLKQYKLMKLFYNFKVLPILVSALLTFSFDESPSFMFVCYVGLRLFIQSCWGWYLYWCVRKVSSFSLRYAWVNFLSIRSVCAHGMPIWGAALIAASTPHIAIILLGKMADLQTVAQYSLALALFMAAFSFLSMMDGWLVPKLSERKASSITVVRKYLEEYYEMYIFITLVVSIGIITFSELGVYVIAGDSYGEAVFLLLGLSCFMTLRTMTIFRNVLILFDKTSFIFYFVAIKFFIEVAAMLILIPYIGAYGILVAQLITFMIIGQLYIFKMNSSIFNLVRIWENLFNKYFLTSVLLTGFYGLTFLLYIFDYKISFYLLCLMIFLSLSFYGFKASTRFKKLLNI